ncbi:hypothetical protein L226DRAFT_540453, partial [Lentinus tigrinus ALCF2SS1-7]
MRWDRSGVVVSEAVDYVGSIEGTKALLEVTYAFAKLSRMMKGVDTTSARLVEGSCGWERMDLLAQPSPHDLDSAEAWFDGPIHEVFRDEEAGVTFGCLSGKSNLHHDPTCLCSGHKEPHPVVPVFSHVRQMFHDSLVEGFPRYRLMVDGEEYLVAKHVSLGFGMVGRGTRGYIALEWKTQRFVFLKDCWRPGYTGVEMEAEILSKLNKAGVVHVPTVVRYGDVYDKVEGEDEPRRQETEASRFHPGRGDKKVDTDLPPFQETVTPPAEPQKKMTDYVKNVEWKPDAAEPAQDKARTVPLPKPDNCTDNVTETSDQASDVDPPAAGSAATLPTKLDFGSSADVTVTPPSTGVRGTKRKLDVFLAGLKRKPGEGLRHMVHTRSVVKEIGLPLTAFTSSRQFVRILYNCITAHAAAYELCGYMHRDVSAGNMLIYPTIILGKDGKYGVSWEGLLTDWELAKHSGKKTAMQPQRTGTWHFMSAYLLLNPNEPTTIADELEAFLHVLIYGCIRRVRSSLDTIHEFLTDYFSGVSFDPLYKQSSVPSSKREAIVNGEGLTFTTRPIVFSTPDGKITTRHPLNSLITELLEIFHSRYAILKWEDVSKVEPESPLPSRQTKHADPWLTRHEGASGVLYGRTSRRKKAESSNPPRLVKPPTPEMYDNVESLSDHATIADIFRVFSMDPKWPSDDVIPDRQAEPKTEKARQQAPAAAAATKRDVSPIPEADEPEDVPICDAGEAEKLEGGSFVADVPDVPGADPLSLPAASPEANLEDFDVITARKTGRDEPDVPLERPRKRRRKDPVVLEAEANMLPQDDASNSELPTRRVTRSRSAANVAAAVAAPGAPAAAGPATGKATTVAQSTRVTRSKSGKLPNKNVIGDRPGASAPTTRRGGRTRAAAAERTQPASKPRRRGAASESTANAVAGPSRRTRRS